MEETKQQSAIRRDVVRQHSSWEHEQRTGWTRSDRRTYETLVRQRDVLELVLGGVSRVRRSRDEQTSAEPLHVAGEIRVRRANGPIPTNVLFGRDDERVARRWRTDRRTNRQTVDKMHLRIYVHDDVEYSLVGINVRTISSAARLLLGTSTQHREEQTAAELVVLFLPFSCLAFCRRARRLASPGCHATTYNGSWQDEIERGKLRRRNERRKSTIQIRKKFSCLTKSMEQQQRQQ
jgi:hypothetical protein